MSIDLNLAKLAARLRQQGIVRVMRNRDYARYILSSWVAMVGLWLQKVGIGWLTWELTHSGAWLGAIALANSLPAILLVPVAGAVADRVDRLAMLRLSHGTSVLVSAGLAGLTFAGLIDIWGLLTISILLGLFEALATPSRMTVAPGLVPREHLSGAIALNSVAFNSAVFVGPAIAGSIISAFGIGWTFALNAIGFTPHLVVLFMVRLRTAEHVAGMGQSLFADIWDALRYIVGHKGIAPVITLALIGGVTVRHLQELMPGFAGAVFHGGPEALGALLSAFGLGGMLGSLWVANRNRLRGATAIFFAGVSLNAAFVFVFAATEIFAVGMAAVFLFGLTMSSSGNCAQTLIQSAVMGSMRARVMSLYSITFRGGPAVGAILFGWLSTYFGLQWPVALGALLCLAISLWLGRGRRAVAGLLETVGEAPPPAAGGALFPAAGEDAIVSKAQQQQGGRHP